MQEQSKPKIHLSSLSKTISSNLDLILDKLGVEYRTIGDRYSMPCPVHGGDNPNGCTIYNGGHPNWSCWTHGCQLKYGKNLFSFVRGILKEDNVNTIKYLERLLEFDATTLPAPREKQPHTKHVEILKRFSKQIQICDEIELLDTVKPSKYFQKRGYSKWVLNKFMVGDFIDYRHFMGCRAIVPVFDHENRAVGYSGRKMSDEDKKYKWVHSKGLKTNSILYGYQQAEKNIKKTHSVTLVEGPGDVWRAWEAGMQNTVAILGASLSENQLLILEQSGALNITILTDFDEAGDTAAQQIIELCGRRFNCFRPAQIKDYNDIGDIPYKELIKWRKEYYE